LQRLVGRLLKQLDLAQGKSRRVSDQQALDEHLRGALSQAMLQGLVEHLTVEVGECLRGRQDNGLTGLVQGHPFEGVTVVTHSAFGLNNYRALGLLENAGHQDSLIKDGQPNGDIQPLGRISMEVPDLSLAQMDQFSLRFDLQVDGTLSVHLSAPEWEGLEVARLDGSQLGKQY